MSIAVQSPIETVKTTLKKTSRAIKITGNPKIFLIGMPGAGKTYWAEKLRSTTKIPSYDLDAIVEVMEERTIKDIFAEDGEDYFRKAETKMLRLFIHCILFSWQGVPPPVATMNCFLSLNKRSIFVSAFIK